MKLCLIGEKVSKSYSKEIHNYMGLDYSLCSVKKEDFVSFVKNSEYNGFNITIPYKKDIIPLLDYVDSDAKSVGAINVVKNEGGKLYGYNTDILGMEYMIKRKGVSLHDKNVLVLGTGGTSNTACSLAKKMGAKSVTVVGRKSPVNYENCYDLVDTQVIINTTPIGMNPDLTGVPIALEKFPSLIAVFDAIYNPLKTALIKNAERLNIVCSGGLPMLVEQALCGEDIWLSSSHTQKDSEKIISVVASRKLNIALTGMAGAGKTQIGKALAKSLSREFFDVDEEVYKKTGKTPSEIITESGEKCFRDIESEVLKELCGNAGLVIATGGGSVLRSENREYISSNCVSVYIKRDLELLATSGRPLSLEKGVKALFEERKAIYELADVTVYNNSTVDSAVKEIIKEYENSCSKWT